MINEERKCLRCEKMFVPRTTRNKFCDDCAPFKAQWWYYKFKSEGRCTKCGAPAFAGMILCEEHALKRNKYKKNIGKTTRTKFTKHSSLDEDAKEAKRLNLTYGVYQAYKASNYLSEYIESQERAKMKATEQNIRVHASALGIGGGCKYSGKQKGLEYYAQKTEN